MGFVKTNYNMMDYLPNESKSTKSLNVMMKEFSTSLVNSRVMIKDVTIGEALAYKEKFKNVDGVKEVLFLDDTVSIDIPLESISTSTLEAWYKDNNALLMLTIDEDKQNEAYNEIRSIIGDNGVMDGEVSNTVVAEESTSKEINVIFMVVIPLLLIILILTTSSYFEPVLFLITIGIALLLNMGSNIFLGEISFVTKAASGILQLAVSIDYSIFLLHKFADFRSEGMNVEDAMKCATKKAFSSITSSGLTTVVGFAALIFMKFKVGPDMGWVMAKGVMFSLLSVLIVLPIIATYSYKLIDKTKHKSFLPDFDKFATFTSKLRKPLCIIFLIILIPSFLGSINNVFNYGASGLFDEKTDVYKEKKEIENLFGKSNQLVIMVPKGNMANEANLINELKNIDEVTSIISYVTSVGESIPLEYVEGESLKQLISDKYSRIILTISCEIEGEKTFDTIEKIHDKAAKYYDDEYYFAGTSVSTDDLKNVVEIDKVVVNAIAIIAIFLILIVDFKSLVLPFILLFVIESAIWINLSINYFSTGTINFVAYLIISSIQLGATIDYAILFTEHYMNNRQKMDKYKATITTIKETFISILTSSTILITCGLLLGINSSNLIISQLGYLIGRGAFISMILVIFVLPGFLIITDRLIEKGTLNVKFYKKRGVKVKKGNNKSKKLLALFVCLLLFSSNKVLAYNDVRKEENIYVNLDYDGVVDGVYVVNAYNLDEETDVCDYGNYYEIRNLSNNNKLDFSDDKTCMTVPKGLFYYQGNRNDKNIPWNVNVSYKLDNEIINASELSGKNGNIEINLNISKNTNMDSFFFDNYLLQVTFTLDSSKVKNINANGGMIANNSGNKQITYSIIAGHEKNIKLSFDATNFSMNGISINAIPMQMDVTIDNIDELISKVKELQNAIKGINEGTGSVHDGISRINAGAKEFEFGSLNLKNGLELFNSNSSKLTEGSKTILDTLKLIPTTLNEKILEVIEEAKIEISENESIQDIINIINENKDEYKELCEMIYPKLQELLEKYDGKIEEIKAIDFSKLFDELISKYSEFDDALNKYVDTVDNIANGYTKMYMGFDALVNGLEELNNGSNTLYGYTTELSNQTSNLDIEINNAINDIQEKFRNSDFTYRSFTSDENTNIGNVQFVIKTKDIVIEKEKVKEKKEKENSFVDKLINLFK